MEGKLTFVLTISRGAIFLQAPSHLCDSVSVRKKKQSSCLFSLEEYIFASKLPLLSCIEGLFPFYFFAFQLGPPLPSASLKLILEINVLSIY